MTQHINKIDNDNKGAVMTRGSRR